MHTTVAVCSAVVSQKSNKTQNILVDGYLEMTEIPVTKCPPYTREQAEAEDRELVFDVNQSYRNPQAFSTTQAEYLGIADDECWGFSTFQPKLRTGRPKGARNKSLEEKQAALRLRHRR